jgi:hypothetical protein
MEGTEQQVNHSVNPWVYESRVRYNQQQIDYRINRVCEFWPRQGELLRSYLLPWREPVTRLGRTRFVARKGKAYDTDQSSYGDAYPLRDFIRRFGIDEGTARIEITRPIQQSTAVDVNLQVVWRFRQCKRRPPVAALWYTGRQLCLIVTPGDKVLWER